MTDSKASFDVFRCPSCGKPTTESLPTCRHCHAQLRGDNAGQKASGIFDTSGMGSKCGGTGLMLAILLVAISGMGFCSYKISESNRIQAEKDAVEKKEQDEKYAAEQAEKRRKGFHCLSGWDGSHPDMVDYVKMRLRDPNSFEHIETRVWPLAPNGSHRILMTFRSKNGFGGMVPGRAFGSFRNRSCHVLLDGVE